MKDFNANIKSKVKKKLALAYPRLGNEKLSKGDTNKGIEYLKKAVEYDNYDAAYLSLAKVYVETGDWNKAIEASENALKYKSNISSGGPYYYMALAYKGKGDFNKSRKMFNQSKLDNAYTKTVEYELSILPSANNYVAKDIQNKSEIQISYKPSHPPILSIDDIFLNKEILNAGESIQLKITVKNMGPGDAQNVYAELSSNTKGLSFPLKTYFPLLINSYAIKAHSVSF